MTQKKVNEEFKTVYAVGMLLIISGHFGSGMLTFHQLFPYDTFHMPLFMFVSGYFYKLENSQNISSVAAYVKKKFTRLIIP